MNRLVTVPPDPRCDDCGEPVEIYRIEQSKVQGVPLGPWQCASCARENGQRVREYGLAHEAANMAQNSSFENICSDVDPKLAEAIHRAGRS